MHVSLFSPEKVDQDCNFCLSNSPLSEMPDDLSKYGKTCCDKVRTMIFFNFYLNGYSQLLYIRLTYVTSETRSTLKKYT